MLVLAGTIALWRYFHLQFPQALEQDIDCRVLARKTTCEGLIAFCEPSCIKTEQLG